MFSFKQTNSIEETIEFTASDDSTWEELLMRFELFCRGCGYLFDGHFKRVIEEPNELVEKEDYESENYN